MMDFFAEKFEGVCNFVAVLNFLFLGIGGLVLGCSRNFFVGLVFMVIGIILALLINIISFGMIAQIITMKNYMQMIYDKLDNNSSTNNEEAENAYNFYAAPESKYSVNTDGSWTCKKCGDTNPSNATACKGCGTYK